MRILLVISFLVIARSDGRELYPRREFSCRATDTNSFDTFLLIQLAPNVDSVSEEMLDAIPHVIANSYDVVAGTVCDSCGRRLRQVELVHNNGDVFKNHTNRDNSSLPRVSPETLQVDAPNDILLYKLHVDQVGECTTAFDTFDKVAGQDAIEDFARACPSSRFFDNTTKTCCCAKSTIVNDVSKEDFRSTLEKGLGVNVLDVLELAHDKLNSCDGLLEYYSIPWHICFDWVLPPDRANDLLTAFMTTYNKLALKNCIHSRMTEIKAKQDLGSDCSGLTTCYETTVTIAAQYFPTTVSDSEKRRYLYLRCTPLTSTGLRSWPWHPRMRNLRSRSENICKNRGPREPKPEYCKMCSCKDCRECCNRRLETVHANNGDALRAAQSSTHHTILKECLCPVGDHEEPSFEGPTTEAFTRALNLELAALGYDEITKITDIMDEHDKVDIIPCSRDFE